VKLLLHTPPEHFSDISLDYSSSLSEVPGLRYQSHIISEHAGDGGSDSRSEVVDNKK
jgi:hypothetical protein